MDLSNNNMIHVKKNGVEYLQFKKLLEYSNLINCYTLSTFNFDKTISNEELNNNYERLCDCLEIKKETIVRPHQSHTDNIKNVTNFSEKYDDIDGLLTNKTNINLMLTFADCTPILIYDPIKKVIGNIHSGWRGTVQKIGKKAVEKMVHDYNSKLEDLIVCMGPCIGKCHFEVSEDVKDIFEDTFKYLNRNCDIIKKSEENNKKYFIDTTLINRLVLEDIGVISKNIFESEICTACNSEYMHSYRVNKEKAGRNVAVLGMK